jgi:tRNA(fMet)-specific endonuclease VapC
MSRLLDTNILSDLIRHPGGQAARRLAEIGDAEIATSVIVAGELRYGAAKKGSPRLTERVEAVLAEIDVVNLDDATATASGEIRATLELSGRVIGQNDLLIAAQAKTLGAVIVTDNVGEFERVEGLVVENWLAT